MTVDLTGRTAVVTGGSAGIGRAIACMLASHGADTYIGDRQLNASNDELFAKWNITSRECDVTDEANVNGLINHAITASGKLDILVNNAGVGLEKQIPDVSLDEWEHVIGVNVTGIFLCCKHAIPYMHPAGGSIINIASNAGILPRAHDPVYSISKGSVVALTKSLALCHSIDKIRVNAICPGPVADTNMINEQLDAADDRDAAIEGLINASPLAQSYRRMGTPDEIAMAAIYLASDAAEMVTGTILAIDGGKSLGVPPRRAA